MRNNCVFCAIIDNEIPSTKVYEDDDFALIKDINPQAKIHLVALPKFHHPFLSETSENESEIIGKILSKVGRMQSKLGLSNGYRVVINQGEDAGQTVAHIHIHFLGGEKLKEL